MGCNPELVSAFLDGEMESIIVDTVARHLLQCDHCCRTLTRLAQVRDMVRDRFALSDPEGLTASVMAAIYNEKSDYGGHASRQMLHDRLLRFGLPAALVSALLGGWLYHAEGKKNAVPGVLWQWTGKPSVAGITVEQGENSSPGLYPESRRSPHE